MPSLVIVDSGSANLNSVYKAAQMVKLQPVITDNPSLIAAADAVIFPGVGSFEHAAQQIMKKKLKGPLLEVIAHDKPFLGICLGMQLLFPHSEESGKTAEPTTGLEALPGLVKRFPSGLPVPHVGWNRVKPAQNSPLFAGLNDGAYFYFTHSYYVQPEFDEHTLALTDYGFPFTAAVARNNLFGVQFHPEKSGQSGLRLLGNFGKIIADHYY